jgi:CxxC motif-containing protein
MIKNLICIQCPRGCHLSIDDETLEVNGNFCPRGANYAKTEITDPQRTITSTVKVVGGEIQRCSVRSSAPIKKGLMMDVMKEINRVSLQAPIEMNQVVIRNVLNTGVDILSTKKVDKVNY